MEFAVDAEGVKTHAERLANLATGGPSVLKAGINANLKVGAKGISAAANVFDHGKPRERIVNHHYVDPGGLQASIGSRLDKGRGAIGGKVGVGVAKTQVPAGSTVSKASKAAVSYGHFVTIGTGKRTTGAKRVWSKKQKLHMRKVTGNLQLNRGVSPPQPFVERGYEQVRSQAEQAATAAMEKRLRKLEG